MDNYVPYHLHSDDSNPTAGNKADSVTKMNQYLDKAQEYGMSAFAFSEHGNLFNWTKKKSEIENRGMKYIGANEVYLTRKIDKDDNGKLILERDNFHYMLIAKNWEGMKELNRLTTISFNKEDGHSYFNPRITFDELKNTSDNILMTSACLASPLWRLYKRAYPNQFEVNEQAKKELDDMLTFMESNKHRMFFEIQYHNHPEQIEYNRLLLNWSNDTGIPLIAAGDTHALNREHAETRKVFLESKSATYGDEDKFDLTFKSYSEFVQMFEEQNALPRNIYLEAIHNTNVMANMVETFSLDNTPKYPRLYDDSENVFKDRIRVGVKERDIHKLPTEEKKEYFKRINDEFDTYKELDAIDYMLLQDDIIKWCHENGIYQGYSRGSVSGSLIAYLLGVTEIDSIKWNMNFTRFLNKDRVTLADIDVDFPPSRRREVVDYIASIKGVEFCEIITFNTMALRGAIENVGRALKVPLHEVDKIKDLAEEDYEEFKKKYPEMEKHVRIMNGIFESIGSHPSGFVVSPISLADNIGLCRTDKSKYLVSQINMKELEKLNFVKLDVLGLDNIEIVNEACELAGIERLTPDNLDFEDEEVWKSIRDDTVGIFQWESGSASRFINQLFSDETLNNIKNSGIKSSFIDLLSIGNGAIRPAGDSYRDKLSKGIPEDNEHEVLNEFLSSTLGQLIYQEQIMEFLVKFCGFTMGESDLVRRGLAKKTGTEQFIPGIKNGFIKTMTEKYGETEEHAEYIIERFLKVIMDSSDYGFSSNHSYPYSMIGYANAWLRYYYPLEFITAFINVREEKEERIAAITDYAKRHNIKFEPIRFGKSRGKYNLNKEENAIYKGLGSIKFLSHRSAEELYQLSLKKDYDKNDFVGLLVDIFENTSVDSQQMEILIRLDFFKEFGQKEVLLEVYSTMADKKKADFELYPEFADYTEVVKGEVKTKKIPLKYDTKHIEKTKEQRLENLRKYEKLVRSRPPREFTPYENVIFEKDMLGYAETTMDVPNSHVIVMDINTKYTPRLTFYQLRTGREIVAKIKKRTFFDRTQGEICKVGDYIEIQSTFKDGRWFKKPESELKPGEFPMYQDMNQLELFIGSLRHIK